MCAGPNKFGLQIEASGAYCIGPDFQPLDKRKFPPAPLGGGDMRDYIAANTTNWPSANNNDERNWDNIGNAAIVMYTVFYRSSWVESMRVTQESAGAFVIIGWIVVMLFTSYYLLNITVSITCAYYSESTVAEAEAAMKRAAVANEGKAKPDDNDDDAEQENQNDEDEQDLSGFQKLPRNIIYDELKASDSEPIGKGCDICKYSCIGIDFAWRAFANFCMTKYPILKRCEAPCSQLRMRCVSGFSFCCHSFIRFSARCTLKGEEEKSENQKKSEAEKQDVKIGDQNAGDNDKDGKDGGTKKKQFRFLSLETTRVWGARFVLLNHALETGAPLSVLTLVSMLGCMLTQGLQNANINEYKCGCTNDDMLSSEAFDALPCTDAGLCQIEQVVNGNIVNVTSTRYQCVGDRCIVQSDQGYACINPWYNHLIAELNRIKGGTPIPQVKSSCVCAHAHALACACPHDVLMAELRRVVGGTRVHSAGE